MNKKIISRILTTSYKNKLEAITLKTYPKTLSIKDKIMYEKSLVAIKK